MSAEQFTFETEVTRLLNIVTNALYSDKSVFLRELISNASDACDRLRYATLTKPELAKEGDDYGIRISFDKDKKLLTVEDNGIGMTRDDLIKNLGTIAHSGTDAFINSLEAAEHNPSLIGQFGVGFYASFMVANKVDVETKRAGEEHAWLWTSEGSGNYTIDESKRTKAGTRITLHMKDDALEFIEPTRIREIVKKYSDHIALPIKLIEGADKEEAVNTASALWTRPKAEITPEQYKEFYHHTGHAFDDPWMTLHYKAEGTLEYTSLLFVPDTRPFDLFHPERQSKLKLYVKRVFITDNCQELLPSYLRFLRGIVDSEDLQLNISREMLQKSSVLAKIKRGIIKQVLDQLQKKAEESPEEYAKFWENFGLVLKEGLYEDVENRDKLMKLVRSFSSEKEGLTSLSDYVSRMKEGQESIYYITGEDLDTLKKSPHLEGFKARGIEVLLMTHPVDEFWLTSVGTYEGKNFKSVTRGASDLDKIDGKKSDENKAEDKTDQKPSQNGPLIAFFKATLGDAVKDVRQTDRLTQSPVCLVADENDVDIRFEKLLRQQGQIKGPTPRVMEINPKHPLIQVVANASKNATQKPKAESIVMLLLDQARIVEGEPLPDPQAFAQRLSKALEKGLKTS